MSEPATKADIDEIKEKLDGKNWWDRWGSTLIVAFIAGSFSIYTTCMTTRNAEQLKNTEMALTRYIEEDKTTGMLIAQERVDFYKAIKPLLAEIDSSFHQVCAFSSVKEGDKLAIALEKYRKLLENSPEGLDNEVKIKLKKYSESVAQNWFELDSIKIDQTKRATYYKNSQNILKEAQDAAKSIMQKRSVPQANS